MLELKNSLENKIMRRLGIHHAITELKLLEMVRETDNKEEIVQFNKTISKLYYKGLIEVVKDVTSSVNIIRTIQDYQ